MYRELKLRAAIIRDKNLILLPNEQVYSKIDGVWNLSSDQGNLGTFFITNVRLVWHANLAENFNVTIPYLQMASVRVRTSKFGPALVVETRQSTGGYLLGFRVDPHERLDEVYMTLQTLYRVYAENPIYGIVYNIESTPQTLQTLKVERKEDELEIIDDQGMGSDGALLAYLSMDEKERANREESGENIVFDANLGLAVEALPEAFSTNDLWSMF
jgi:Bardet-Biedl syndrome 5 protein